MKRIKIQQYTLAMVGIPTMLFFMACSSASHLAKIPANALQPTVVTQQTPNDTDDPAIWINPSDPTKSLIIGTDKMEKTGGLYVFDLEGRIVRKVENLDRPNNVDIAYNFNLNGHNVDIAVTTERGTNRIRIYTLPEMKPIDNGGIDVFVGETERGPMGVALYSKTDGSIYAIVGRKSGPADQYLFQYKLDGSSGTVKADLVRKFGQYSGLKEIEAIAVDNELGYVYYSDETYGIRKYYADPTKGSEELAVFGQKDFLHDMEGIAIYKSSEKTGYLVISDQQRNMFNVYKREGAPQNPHLHTLVTSIPMATIECDGADATSANLGGKFPKGLFVAMSNGKVFKIYDWQILENWIDSHHQ